jgi:hypothetical protein
MSSNLTQGQAIQVGDNSVFSINLALQQIVEQLDHLKGLRGRSETWDRHRVSSPTQAADAVDLGSLEEREALFHLTLLASATGIALTPGTTYVEVAPLLRQPVNFSVPLGLTGRLIAGAWGTDTGAGEKGVALVDDDENVLVEVEWAGADQEVRIGEFTSITASEDLTTRLYVKGATAEETLVLYQVAIEFRFDSGAGVE